MAFYSKQGNREVYPLVDRREVYLKGGDGAEVYALDENGAPYYARRDVTVPATYYATQGNNDLYLTTPDGDQVYAQDSNGDEVYARRKLIVPAYVTTDPLFTDYYAQDRYRQEVYAKNRHGDQVYAKNWDHDDFYARRDGGAPSDEYYAQDRYHQEIYAQDAGGDEMVARDADGRPLYLGETYPKRNHAEYYARDRDGKPYVILDSQTHKPKYIDNTYPVDDHGDASYGTNHEGREIYLQIDNREIYATLHTGREIYAQDAGVPYYAYLDVLLKTYYYAKNEEGDEYIIFLSDEEPWYLEETYPRRKNQDFYYATRHLKEFLLWERAPQTFSGPYTQPKYIANTYPKDLRYDLEYYGKDSLGDERYTPQPRYAKTGRGEEIYALDRHLRQVYLSTPGGPQIYARDRFGHQVYAKRHVHRDVYYAAKDEKGRDYYARNASQEEVVYWENGKPVYLGDTYPRNSKGFYYASDDDQDYVIHVNGTPKYIPGVYPQRHRLPFYATDHRQHQIYNTDRDGHPFYLIQILHGDATEIYAQNPHRDEVYAVRQGEECYAKKNVGWLDEQEYYAKRGQGTADEEEYFAKDAQGNEKYAVDRQGNALWFTQNPRYARDRDQNECYPKGPFPVLNKRYARKNGHLYYPRDEDGHEFVVEDHGLALFAQNAQGEWVYPRNAHGKYRVPVIQGRYQLLPHNTLMDGFPPMPPIDFYFETDLPKHPKKKLTTRIHVIFYALVLMLVGILCLIHVYG